MTSFKEALMISQNLGRKASVINALEGMASLAGALGEPIRAARLWGAAEASREVVRIALPPDERALHEPYLAAARSWLENRTWEEALAEGHAMSLEEAAEYALSREESDTPATPASEELPTDEPLGMLTPREQEVAALVARGLTNRQVSTTLGISERTAGNHVARILRKLGLRSRAQIATWATEHKVLAPDPD
jgi:DNA-binding CsgD family transcriptional regulator